MLRDPAYLVLEVLPRNKRVEQQLPVLAGVCKYFATSASNIRVLLKALVQLINTLARRFGPDIEQNADVWADQGSKRIEEPSV